MLHPDRQRPHERERATREFMALQARFNEATSLLNTSASADSWQHTDDRSKESAKWGSARQGRGGHANETETGYRSTASGVPFVGLPSPFVYIASGSLAVTIVMCLIFSPATDDDQRKLMSQLRAGGGLSQQDITKLRHVLEDDSSSGLGATRNAYPAPAANHQFDDDDEAIQGLDAYFRLLAKRASKSGKPPSDGRVSGQTREGVELDPSHVAAQDGQVWWIERCSAREGCRMLLDKPDRRGDAPLHHCARFGQSLACQTLLRVGADPTAVNKWRLRPEDLANHMDHKEIAQMLRGARIFELDPRHADSSARDTHQRVQQHPDGFGKLLQDLPEDVYYYGPTSSESLRHAVNLTVGQVILRKLYMKTPPTEQELASDQGDQGVDNVIEILSHTIAKTGFELETLPVIPKDMLTGSGWTRRDDGAKVYGLLLFESPGSVTPDAHSHWVAIRHSRSAQGVFFFRLDPLRGPYSLTAHELSVLLNRYRAWRIVHPNPR